MKKMLSEWQISAYSNNTQEVANPKYRKSVSHTSLH